MHQSTGLVACQATANLSTTDGESITGVGEHTTAKLSVAQILRSQCAAYVKQYAGRGACFQVQSVLAKLSLCRTRALGGRKYECNDCGGTTEVFHSCGDRHCPQCSGCKRYDFASRTEQLILPEVTYYQVVFTLPAELSEMALGNREVMADLLFESAAASLRKTIRSQQDFDPATMMVLHTWNQQLQPHWHVHALVPGGGPSLSNGQWKPAQSPTDNINNTAAATGTFDNEANNHQALNSDGYYLVDAISLREAYRKSALSRLRKLYTQGELKLGGQFAYLEDPLAWKKFCDDLAELNWVSFIQPPPTKSSSADQIVRYLTRYLTGGPISDSRIIAANRDEVTFMAREGKRIGGQREQVPVTLSTVEFTRRWCLHIQPDQLTKTRYFGGWCSRKRTQYQLRCRELLAISTNASAGTQSVDSRVGSTNASTEQSPNDVASESTSSVTISPQSLSPALAGDSLPAALNMYQATDMNQARRRVCPGCASPWLRLIRHTTKPSWTSLLSHRDSRCPDWYAKTERQAFCEHLEREHRIGYEDWCLALGIESTMSQPHPAPAHPAPAQQLYLPGLYPESGYLIDSF